MTTMRSGTEEKRAYLARKHTDLWQEQTRLLKRMVSLAVIGAYLVFAYLHNLEPNLRNLSQGQADVARLAVSSSALDLDAASLQDLDTTLAGVKEVLAAEPWRVHIDRLIADFFIITREETARRQQRADEAVRAIYVQVSTEILAPVERGLSLLKETPEFDGLRTAGAEASQELETWLSQKLGKKWYPSVDDKQKAVEALKENLALRLGGLKSALASAVMTVDARIKEVELKRNIVANELDNQSRQVKTQLEGLYLNLDGVFPKWVRNVLPADVIIPAYPAALFLATLLVLTLGLSLSGHFATVIGAYKLDAQAAGVGTLWTIAPKSGVRLAVTVCVYALFVSYMYFLEENAVHLLMLWLRGTGRTGSLLNLAWPTRALWLLMAGFWSWAAFRRISGRVPAVSRASR